MVKAGLFSAVFLGVVGYGSCNNLGFVPYLVLMALFTCLISFKYIPESYYPLVIYVMAVALLWQTSMLGMYVVGTDIHTEVYTANKIMQHGWDFKNASGNDLSFAIAVVAPAIGHLGLSAVWQFKMLFPLWYAFTPVILYFAFKKHFGARNAFLSALFIVLMPMFVLDMTSHAKGMAAHTFWAFAIYFLLSDHKLKVKLTGLGLSGILAAICHYAVAGMAVIYALSFIVIIGVAQLPWFKQWYASSRAHLAVGIVLVVSILATVGLWYSIVGQGAMLKQFTSIGGNIVTVSAATAGIDDSEESAALVDKYKEFLGDEGGKGKGIYLESQPPLVKMALGLDFMDATWQGKLFRILQYISELAIMLGFTYILLRMRRKGFSLTYVALALSAVMVLLACLFVPFFGVVGSVSRTYMIALYILAPLLVLGLVWLARLARLCKPHYAVVLFLIFYGLFTTGVIFEVSRYNGMRRVDIPYSIALSDHRLNLSGHYTMGDRYLANWVKRSGIGTIYTDYNGAVLLLGCCPWVGIQQTTDVPAGSYVFLTSWSAQNGKLVYGTMPGLRWLEDVPDYWVEGKEICESGSARLLQP